MSASILVVDDEPAIRETLRWCLEQEGHRIVAVESGEEAVTRLHTDGFDVIISDIIMPGIDGLEVLQQARVLAPRTAVILITAYATVETAVEALRRGAADYILKPFRLDKLRARVQQLLAGRAGDRAAARTSTGEPTTQESLVGRSPAVQALRARIARVASTASHILITGETGTGKELVARAIHAASPRRDQQLVPINCGAIPEDLFESALFGHVRGAFTGAVQANPGLMALAHHGTLFLDEVGETPLHLQVKLLRVVEEKEVWAVGRTAPRRVDCRIIASSNRDLRREVDAGRFRGDLFYRLNVVPIAMPALRDRREDIPVLVEHFIHRLNSRLETNVRGIDPAALPTLMNRDWPGNVRELLHVIERTMISGGGDLITLDALAANLTRTSFEVSLKEATRRFERQHILDVLARTEFDKRKAAQWLGLSRASLYRKLDREGLLSAELR